MPAVAADSERASLRRAHSPIPARQYSAMVTNNKACIPNTRERFSNRPPTTAPRMFAPRAALGEDATRNSRENSMPAKNTGTEKTPASNAPTTAGEPGTLDAGNQYAA